MTTRFTDELMEQGLTYKVLTLVSQIDVNNEFEKLQRERGLGSEKHRKEVSDLIKECRQSLAESLFAWACQSPLGKDDTLLLIGHLERVTVEANGSLDAVNLALLMALLYCFDSSFIEESTEERDGSELYMIHQLPLLTERQYIATIHSRLQDSQPWKLPGLQATVRLAWALALRGISQLPDVTALAEFTEADEAMAELAIADNVFLFLTESVVVSENFYQEEFYIRRIHNLITDFLALMPMKVVLSKFVRQMGDLLPPTIYIPYLKMLQGLANGPQCAHYCFSLLKVNGSSHVENIQGAGGSPVSWEHFFHSLMLYHEHLRKDLPSADSVQYRHLPSRGITQKEQDGLIAFLQLTSTIITWSENARLALCEHPQWTPVVVTLGLLQCSIPPVLKAELLKTLAAFGKSPEIAASLWQSLEYTQVKQLRNRADEDARMIHMSMQMGNDPPISLRRDLEHLMLLIGELYKKNPFNLELALEYWCPSEPLQTSTILGSYLGVAHQRPPQRQLISTLVESSFPSNLGAGLRPPGFDPYLQFLRDSVFLRFRTRAYRRAAEKWEVAEVVLEVFYKLLRDYEPQLEDFVDQFVELQGEEIIAYKPPGFSLMYHLLNESPMLELALSLLEEGVKQLDTYAPFPGKKHLEKAVQHCLALLNLTLQKENLFMDLLRESQLALIVSPLEQLLQGINPRTKKADNVVNIARYLYHGNTNPELAFESAKILCCISCNSNIQIKLVGDFTHDQSVSQKLMAGFVECLDSEDTEEFVRLEEGSELEKKLAGIRHETRIHILNLLITSLERNPPNLALYLLGFELKKPVSTTNLQDPEYEISMLNQMSWLMKTASIELRVTSLNRQRSHTQRLLHLLLDDMPVKPYSVRRKILSILDSIDFSQEIPEPLQLDFFDRAQIEQVIANCEHKNLRGQTVCNVKEISTILQYVVGRNKLLQCLHAKRHALESWRQLVEIILTACPQDLIQAEDRHLIIRDLLQDVHDKILDDEAAQELMPVVAGAVFTLTAHLSQAVRTEQKQPLVLGPGEVHCAFTLDSSFSSPPPTENPVMLALALLDRIVSVDKQQQWLLYLSNSGYLKVLVDSLVEDDRTLQSLLTPQPPLLKALYTYESKMVILTSSMAQHLQAAGQRQCLGLLSRFGGSDRLRQFKFQDDNVEGDRVSRKDEIELAMQQICANVMEYCQSLLLQSSPTFQHAVCLFTPSLSETINRDGPRQDTQAPVVPYWHLPGLGIIVYLLRQSANDFFSYYDSHRRSVNKLQNVEQLPPDEIKELQADAISAFGESLQKKLLDIEGLYSKVRSRYSFIQALVRRIRGLLRISRN
ncbi:NUP205 [Cervus elaphus hippelaphus]|uniref:NUP205 n=1 Tax=Cervus elaphus hippelaphus TaxID=46360 RepID=A0A212CL09_CEREH|nr:NUP205 [Cervus elaphus hippelaphus]